MKYIIYPILILLMISLVSGLIEYNNTGSTNHKFQLGTGVFGTTIADVQLTGNVIFTDPRQQPLVSDLDNDGTNEIIALNSNSVRLYQDKELNIVDTYNMISDTEYSNMIVFDLDGDSYNEIVVAEISDSLIYILEYNGTSFHLQNSLNFSGRNNSGNGDTIIGCKSAGDCLMIYGEQDTSNPNTDNLYATFFDSSSLGAETVLYSGTHTVNRFCAPHIRDMTITDFDNDGDIEYIASFYENDASNLLDIVVVYTEGGASPTLDEDITITDSTFSVDGFDCLVRQQKIFTPPLVHDFDGSSSNGLETVIAYMVDSDEFRLVSYDSTGGGRIEYPAVAENEGVLVSNAFLVDVFDNSGNDDFCVVGFNDDDNELDILCGSMQGVYSVGFIDYNNVEFNYDISNLYNISNSTDVYNSMAHSVQHSNALTEGLKDIPEILTTYGIFNMNIDTCNAIANCDASLLYENPKPNTALISIDAEKFGGEDLVGLTPTNLIYLDDSLSNEPAIITSIVSNPCVTDSIIKVNSTVQFTVTVTDQNPSIIGQDQVNAKLSAYYLTTNEINVSSVNGTSGSEFTLTFTANKTIVSGIIQVEGKDTANPTEIDIVQIAPFIVQNNGLEFGDSECELYTAETIEEEEEATTGEGQDDAITRGLDEILDTSGAGLGRTTLWLLIMLIVMYAIWTSLEGTDFKTRFGIIAIAELFMIIIGTRLAYLSTGLIVTISIVGVIIIALWVGRKFTGTDSR